MDVSVTKKLQDLWALQQIDTKLDNVRLLMGELPMEVADLEDEITGLNTRIENISQEIKQLESEISAKKTGIKDFNKNIEKYDDQLNNIKNSREYDAIMKEKEIAGLEILQAEKRMKEMGKAVEMKKEMLAKAEEDLSSKQKDLDFKKEELREIEKENEEEISKFAKDREKALSAIEARLARAYTRIRGNMRNGIAVAPIIRNSCGGCFSKIPPQRHSDIRAHYRIIDCENCGRILVDASVTGIEAKAEVKEEKTTRRRLKIGGK